MNLSVSNGGTARTLSLLANLVIMLVLVLSSAFAVDAWRQNRRSEIQQMESVVALMTRTLDTFLLAEQAGLLSLADAIEALPGGLGNLAGVQKVLAAHQAYRPELLMAFVARMDGQLLASSHTSLLSGLPSIADQPSFRTFKEQYQESRSVYVGRVQVSRTTGQLAFSLRYVIRDKAGKPLASIAAVMPTGFLESLWKDAPSLEKMTLGVLRDDGYLLGRHPVPEGVVQEEVFTHPRTGALIAHLQDHAYPAAGTVEGASSLLGVNDFVYVFRRLAHFPLTVFVAQPARQIQGFWLSAIAGPAALLLLLTLAIKFASIRLIRQDRAAQAQGLQAEAALRKSESEQRFLIDHLMAGVIIHDARGEVLRCNLEASHVLGLSFEQMAGRELIDPAWGFLQEDGSPMPLAQYPVSQVLATGKSITNLVVGVRKPQRSEPTWALCRADPWFDEAGQLDKIIVTFVEITDRLTAQTKLEVANAEMRRVNEQLAEVAHFDALTHLPNRVLLADRLQQAMAYSSRSRKSVAVAFLDLDGFKEVNDKYGHLTGDHLLVAISRRLKTALREGDTLSRIGGDEFVAVMTDLSDGHDAEPLLQRLLQVAAEPVHVEGHDLQVSASIGVTVFPQDGASPEQLLRHADQAMYQAKQAGKNRIHLFDVASDAAIRVRRESVEQIGAALQHREFVLHYQPQVNMATGEVVGAEALIRWQHPQRGLLAPGQFLPVIEDHDLAVGIGEQVMEMALEQMALWQGTGIHLPVSVNVFSRQMEQGDFVQKLRTLFARHPDVQPGSLELEIVETSALADIDMVSALMQGCAGIGVAFALDDFGTGYSSLTYLKKLPAKRLKIDQSFVRDMLEDQDDLAIVQGVIGLSRAFGREVMAEGVETVAHGRMLVSMGCELAQGYGIARPMPGADLARWLAQWTAQAPWIRRPD
ncbi:MAG: EAL domain-containing protein [Hylemonella sp.]|nr:EAL domain-containing protein [Hylemonella sp.]